MTVEARFWEVLSAVAVSPLMDARKSVGYAWQDDEKEPTTVPLCVIQRTGTEYMSTICATYAEHWATIAVVHVARERELAREQAQQAAMALVTSDEVPELQSDSEDFDTELNAWVVTQIYRVFCDAEGF